MTHSSQLRPIVTDRQVNGLRRIMAVIWAVAATALALIVAGSPLIAFDQPLRIGVTIVVGVSAVVMAARAVAPRRRVWRGWTLLLIGGAAVASFSISLFTLDELGGLTYARAGWSLLLLTVAAVAYLHWLGEQAFLQ